MCIALISTSHPKYSLILLDNRDEFLNRPTAKATWWPAPDEHVLGGYDLLRDTHGTWLAVTKDGRIAVLTNFREASEAAVGAESRGGMIKAFLTGTHTSEETTEDFVKSLVASGAPQRVGGFSLVCGRVGEPLAIISNRVSSEHGISWVAEERDQTVGLSNAAFEDKSWPKVLSGEKLLEKAIAESSQNGESERHFIDRLLELLSTDTLPRKEGTDAGLETHINQLRETIFVPALGRKGVQSNSPEEVRASKANEVAQVVQNGQPSNLDMSGLYGTQQQTVILVEHSGRMRYFERTLYDTDSVPIEKGFGDVDVEFMVKR